MSRPPIAGRSRSRARFPGLFTLGRTAPRDSAAPRLGRVMPLTVRLGLFYGAIFVGTGASSPYLPVWFAHHGLSGAQIGLILSLPGLARVVTAPLLGVWADSFRLRRTALLIMALAVTGLYALLA